MMNVDYSFGPTSALIIKLFLFSAYNTLKCALFIVRNIVHNNRCRTALESLYVTF
ncbi:hypothetical protein DBA60_01565 [Bacillus anthracis]|nr:hypothetical protein CEQ19_30220 [Bacillus anthracis]AWU54164.1 hypothetical protein DNQ11_17615 [Bacillus anthracis]PNS48506.1 hypothetical protein C2L81_17730 [Bacillus anthracis]PNS55302.1 hypothetical protein C2L75_12935 [Bacillus anthracis]PNS61651.1 hypothetical protein C2L76_08425 [Bacillus anthracis]